MTTTLATRPTAPSIAVRRAPFDAVTIGFHWTTVLLVAGLFALGWSMGPAPDARAAGLLLTAHRSLGVTVWSLSVARAVWRRTGARLPPFPPTMSPAQQRAAKLNEYALYALLLTQPITGVLQS